MPDTARNDSISVGLTAVEILRPRVSGDPRKLFYIYNSSAGGQTVTLVFGDEQAIAANTGIVLAPGASYMEAIDQEFTPWSARCWAIASAAGGSISLVER